jgi:hypothetical protein
MDLEAYAQEPELLARTLLFVAVCLVLCTIPASSKSLKSSPLDPQRHRHQHLPLLCYLTRFKPRLLTFFPLGLLSLFPQPSRLRSRLTPRVL